jgi:putative sigma-54 modulation protein
METQMHAIHFKADQKLLSFIQEKLSKLEHYNHHIISAEVFLRLEKDNEKGNKVTEIKLLVPGKELFAKRQCRSFEEAADGAVEALRRQVMREKNRN